MIVRSDFRAEMIARGFHEGQEYDGLPYATHLEDVVKILHIFGTKPQACETHEEVISAAWLHDVLEDTLLHPQTFTSLFSQRICQLVKLLTDAPGKNRDERHEKTWPGIAEDQTATRIKLADRLANVNSAFKLMNSEKDFLQMYHNEQKLFKKALYTPGQNEDMWARLEATLGVV